MSTESAACISDHALAMLMAAMLRAAWWPAGAVTLLLLSQLLLLAIERPEQPIWLALALALLLGWQLLLLWRIALDARLFQAFAGHELEPNQFDQALSALEFRAPKHMPRSMLDRVNGAKGLLRQQGLLTLCGLGMMLIGLHLAASSSHV